MNFFDILLAKKLSGGSPTPPGDTYERKSVTSYPVTDSANYPLPKVDVTVTDADKCEVIVTTDNTITEDSGVYIERQSGGGNRELDEIVGVSIVWNQLVRNTLLTPTSTVNDVTFMNNGDGSFDISGTASENAQRRLVDSFTVPSNHKFLILTKPIGTDCMTQVYANNSATRIGQTGASAIVVANQYDSISLFAYVPNGKTAGVQGLRPNIIDLTAVFGSTIADYIYSLEQATAGSGIAWLKSYGYLTEDYYGYTANKIESVSVVRHVMKDSNDSVIDSYAINPITLRGIPKLNASNQLYYDGDIYEASGRVTRKYGVVDLGTLPWTYQSTYNTFTATVDDIYDLNQQDYGKGMMCDKYITSNYWWTDSSKPDKSISHAAGKLIAIKDTSYNDSTTFKTAMSGVYLIYEKATPTIESTSPFELNQIVDANGTEEYIDAGVEAGTRDVAIPVGHDTKYFNGKAYVKPLTAGTSDTVSMADMGIMPTSPMYIEANGEIDAEYWKQTE